MDTGEKIDILIQARSLIKDVKVEEEIYSDVWKALEAASTCVELAWGDLEKRQLLLNV